jgi:gluconolactonase
MSADAVTIELDMAAPGAERVLGRRFEVDVIAKDVIFGEGPVWERRSKTLWFTDIIGDTIWKWKPNARAEAVLKPSRKANGMTTDLEGRIVVAGWGGRTVFRFEKDGSVTTLATEWQGKKLNSPNDIVVKSDGSIYFTDPPGGLLNVGMVQDDLQKYLDIQGVYRIFPNGRIALVTDDFVYPNGLCFSPDEKLLYVNCSRERLIRVYPLNDDGTLGSGKVFHQYTGTERGNPDGMKCDVDGRVYCTGPGGIWVHEPDGTVLARLKTPGHHPTNFAFGGDDWRSFFITFIGCVGGTRLATEGVGPW